MAIDFLKSSKGSGISYLDYMIAHYKCNEEKGLIVFNHSSVALAGGGRLSNLDVTDQNQNILANPSMEEWDDPNTPTGWTPEPGDDGEILQEDTEIYDGLYACKMTTGAIAIPQISQIFEVEEDDTFILNFMTRGDGINDGLYGLYSIGLADWIIPLTHTGKTGTEYEQVLIENINLVVGFYALFLTGPLLPLEIILNGNLENWINAINAANWSEGFSGSSSVNREDVLQHLGLHCLRLDIDAPNNTAYITQPFTLIPGKRYRLTGWYFNNLPGKTGRVILYNTGYNVSLKADGTWQASTIGFQPVNALAWTKISIDFIAHSSYSQYQLDLTSGLAASSSIYFDDWSIIPLNESYYDKIFFSYADLSTFWDTEKGFVYSPFSSNFKFPEHTFDFSFKLIKCYASKAELIPHYGKGYFGFFVKRIENWGLTYENVLVDFGNASFPLNIIHPLIAEYNLFDSLSIDLNEWHFIFFSGYKFYIINESGEMIFESDEYDEIPLDFTTENIAIGFDVSGFTAATDTPITSGCIFGDVMIISSHNTDSPIDFTISQWAKKYDELRSRYGMAARDGW